MSQIAFALGSSTRTVSRWAAGYSRPLPTFEREIQKIVQAGGVQ
jgi:DNA-binding transcriptional regulator YiaG